MYGTKSRYLPLIIYKKETWTTQAIHQSTQKKILHKTLHSVCLCKGFAKSHRVLMDTMSDTTNVNQFQQSLYLEHVLSLIGDLIERIIHNDIQHGSAELFPIWLRAMRLFTLRLYSLAMWTFGVQLLRQYVNHPNALS